MRIWYFRPFVLAALGMAGFCLFFGGFTVWADAMFRRVNEGVPFQQAEATCERSTANVSGGWSNTFLLNGVERTSLDTDGCTASKHYVLHYRIWRTGHLEVESGKRL